MLLRLGLRSGEVAGLRLDDIDWRAGELRGARQGRAREDRLPLPADVGEAIASYLRRGRPRSERREVFLRARAPFRADRTGTVASTVRRACRRAGIAEVGSHRLRHTAACEMVGARVPLDRIGQVLRHRSLQSTAIYARVDLDRLRQLAAPWPGGADNDEAPRQRMSRTTCGCGARWASSSSARTGSCSAARRLPRGGRRDARSPASSRSPGRGCRRRASEPLGEAAARSPAGSPLYLQTIDPATEIPPAGVFPVRRQRPTPYLFSRADICRLLEAARELRPPLRAASYEALFGLLAVSGMRIGEAVALEPSDVDLDAGVITIRKAEARPRPARAAAPEHDRRAAPLRRASETAFAQAALEGVLSLERRHRHASRAR